MSIVLESSTSDRIQRSSGFLHGMSYIGIYDSTGDQRFSAAAAAAAAGDEGDSCSSSSIGKNSDSCSDGDGDSGDGEVQSSYQGPLNSLDALEEVLPIKRGISKFYSGKSKSFTSLADVATCSSIKDIAKSEDAYTRKRKNLLAHSIFLDKNQNFSSRSNSGGISKRLASSNRSTLALGLTMASCGNNNNNECSSSSSSSPHLSLPPLPPHGRRRPNNEPSFSPPRQNFSPWRSFSLSDLQHAAAATPTVTGSVINNKDKEEKLS